jgi:hypothetical protein
MIRDTHEQTPLQENKRPIFRNDVRDLQPDIARIAVFIIPLAFNIRDGREPSEQSVASCEGDRCTIKTRATLDPTGGGLDRG